MTDKELKVFGLIAATLSQLTHLSGQNDAVTWVLLQLQIDTTAMLVRKGITSRSEAVNRFGVVLDYAISQSENPDVAVFAEAIRGMLDLVLRCDEQRGWPPGPSEKSATLLEALTLWKSGTKH